MLESTNKAREASIAIAALLVLIGGVCRHIKTSLQNLLQWFAVGERLERLLQRGLATRDELAWKLLRNLAGEPCSRPVVGPHHTCSQLSCSQSSDMGILSSGSIPQMRQLAKLQPLVRVGRSLSTST